MACEISDDQSVPFLAGESRCGRWWSSETAEEAKTQVVFAVPMVLTNVSLYAIPLVSVMFVGHLGSSELAAATLANSWAAFTGFIFVIGLSGSLETLCGQNYGAKQYRMLGIHLQSLLIMSFLFSIMISILWFFSDRLLVILHQNPEISKMAGTFLVYLIPGLFAFGFLQCILRFLQTQNIVKPLVLCSVVPLLLHVGITYILVHALGLGFKGASLAASISLWLSLIMLTFYINFSKRFLHTWEGFAADSFWHVVPNLKLSIASAVMVSLEFCAFELLVLLAGLLSDSETSTSIIAMCVTTEAVIYNVTFGFSAAVSTRVSNELGAGNTRKAKSAMAVTLKLSFGIAVILVLLLFIGHVMWAKMFSESTVIIDEFARMTPFLAISLLLDSIQGILSGVARGCGSQHVVSFINLGAFYAIGMPLSCLFGFTLGLQDKGLWLGLICGLFCQASSLMFFTLRINWSELKLFVDDERSNVMV